MQFKTLKQFKQDELFVDENETIVILKFIFSETDHPLIDTLPMSDQLRGFAQGLLVEAIDASYNVGPVHNIFRSTANPKKSAMKIIRKFAKKSMTTWYKHATVHDLMTVEIYDFVREQLAVSFRKRLQFFLAKDKSCDRIAEFIAYNKPPRGAILRWA